MLYYPLHNWPTCATMHGVGPSSPPQSVKNSYGVSQANWLSNHGAIDQWRQTMLFVDTYKIHIVSHWEVKFPFSSLITLSLSC